MRAIFLILFVFLGCNTETTPPPTPALSPVEQLMAEVRTGAPPVRIAAAGKLAQLGKGAAQAVQALADALNHPETRVKLAALNALDQLARAGVAVDDLGAALVALLAHEAAPVRAGAAALLGRVKGFPEAAPALAAHLGDAAGEVRGAAARSLSRLGEAARPALAELAAHAQDADMAVRLWTRQAITALDPTHAASLLPLLKLLADPNLHFALKGQAEQILASLFTGEAAALTPALAAILEDAVPGHEQAVREVAMRAVRLLGGDLGSVPKMLLAAARDPQDPLRVLALEALRALGGKVRDLAPEIPVLLQDGDALVREAAALTLGALTDGGQAILPALEKAVDDPVGAVRAAALSALGALVGRTEAERLLPILVARLKDTSAVVRAAAAQALGRAGSLLEDASGAVGPLAAAVADQTEEVALAALAGLKSLGSKAKDAWPAVIEVASAGSAALKSAAADTVGAMGEAAREAGPALRKLVGRDEALDAALLEALKAVEPPAEVPQ